MLQAAGIVIAIWWIACSVYVAYRGSRRRPNTNTPYYLDSKSEISKGLQLLFFVGMIILAPIALIILGIGYLAKKKRG